jgi:hypothetical protein
MTQGYDPNDPNQGGGYQPPPPPPPPPSGPPPASYGQQPGQPAYGGGGFPPPSDSSATVALIVGILSIFICAPISGIVGLVLANSAAKKNPAPSDLGKIKAGKICSIISIVLGTLGILLWLLIVVLGAANGGSTTY